MAQKHSCFDRYIKLTSILISSVVPSLNTLSPILITVSLVLILFQLIVPGMVFDLKIFGIITISDYWLVMATFV